MMYGELVKRMRSQCRGYGKECEDCNADGNCRSQMENEAADAIEELICEVADEHNARLDAEERQRWIPVTERLPEAGERVLCYCRANICEVMKMRTSGDWVHDLHHIYMHSFVTHWMPLPKGPEEE